MLLAPFGPAQSADHRQMIEVNLLGVITATEVAVRTDLVGHLAHAQTKRGVEQLEETSSLAAEDIAQIIGLHPAVPATSRSTRSSSPPAGQASIQQGAPP